MALAGEESEEQEIRVKGLRDDPLMGLALNKRGVGEEEGYIKRKDAIEGDGEARTMRDEGVMGLASDKRGVGEEEGKVRRKDAIGGEDEARAMA